MNPELYALFMSYQDKELDDDFIYRAFDIMMKYETGLKDYVEDFKINEHLEPSDIEDGVLGTYSVESRVVSFHKEIVLGDGRFPNKKLLTLEVLRHELEHARSLQRLYERKFDIETMVINYSMAPYAIRHQLYRGSRTDKLDPDLLQMRKYGTYEIDPGERIAEIKAWKFMVNLLKNQRRTDDLLLARSMLYYSYIKGYRSNGYYLEPPTYEFLLALGLYHSHYLLRKLFKNTYYNLDTRLLCGLPISEEEYNEKVLRKVKLQKRTKTYTGPSGIIPK